MRDLRPQAILAFRTESVFEKINLRWLKVRRCRRVANPPRPTLRDGVDRGPADQSLGERGFAFVSREPGGEVLPDRGNPLIDVAGVLGLIHCGELVVDTGQLGNIQRRRKRPPSPSTPPFS